MPRFEASIITAFGEIGPDILEVADVTAAKTAARLTAERLICNAARHLPVSRALTIEIADETGTSARPSRRFVEAWSVPDDDSGNAGLGSGARPFWKPSDFGPKAADFEENENGRPKPPAFKM
jgi:hypothetical protein